MPEVSGEGSLVTGVGFASQRRWKNAAAPATAAGDASRPRPGGSDECDDRSARDDVLPGRRNGFEPGRPPFVGEESSDAVGVAWVGLCARDAPCLVGVFGNDGWDAGGSGATARGTGTGTGGRRTGEAKTDHGPSVPADGTNDGVAGGSVATADDSRAAGGVRGGDVAGAAWRGASAALGASVSATGCSTRSLGAAASSCGAAGPCAGASSIAARASAGAPVGCMCVACIFGPVPGSGRTISWSLDGGVGPAVSTVEAISPADGSSADSSAGSVGGAEGESDNCCSSAIGA